MLRARGGLSAAHLPNDMQTFQTILLILLVVDAIALVTLVMLQQGKGADVGAAFGSGSANTLFGSAGSATFLTKASAWLAIGFFAISFGLAYTAKEQAELLREFRVTDQVTDQVESTLPDEEPAAEGETEPAADPTEADAEDPEADLPDV